MHSFFVLLDEAATPVAGPNFIWFYLIFLVAMIVLMFLPQRKRQKEQEKMQSSVQNGDWILLNNGMYGKVVNLVNNCVIVEFGTNKSIMIPVLKNQIYAISEPDLTPHAVDEKAIAPENPIVAEDVPTAKDGLDDYDRYILEQGAKKKGLFGKKKKNEE